MKKNIVIYSIMRDSAGAVAQMFGRLEVRGREYIPATGPFILASNHLSHLDPPILAKGCPRYLYFMAKEELFKVPLLGKCLYGIGTFPVKRGTADRTALRQALDVLANGQPLAMFPEGRRSDDGKLQPGEQGVGLIALRSRALILPAAIVGSQTVLPPHAIRPHFGKITLRFGTPFTLDDLYEQSGREAVNRATERIMEGIARLLPPEHHPLPVGIESHESESPL